MEPTITKIDTALEEYLIKKAPPLSPSAKETLVKIAPYLALIFGILAIPALLAAVGISAVATPFMMLAGQRTLFYWIWLVCAGAQVVYQLLAVKPLFARKAIGWKYIFYSSLIGVLASVSNLSIFSLLMTVLSFYLLYQVKASYT